jgi:hypothetical protein
MNPDQVDVNVSEKSGFGSGFQDARSWLFRAEYSAILVAIVAYLIWRTFNLGGLVFAATWAIFSAVYWPLLGWLVHIMIDRAVGYTLHETHHGKNSPFSRTKDPILNRS